MLRNLNVTTGGRRILGVPDVGILAATIASQTASGTNGAGLLYDESINPANSGKQLRIDITSIPGSGTLFVYENGSFDFDGAANGTYSIGYDWYADDVLGGADTATVVVGAADGSATGATLTGVSSISAGSAYGTAAGAAAGVTLNGASTLVVGSASGTAAGAAAGVTLTGTSTVVVGGASGTADGSAAGLVLDGTSTLIVGSASGTTEGAASGVTLTGGSSLVSGSASGTASGGVAGVVLNGASVLVAGSAHAGGLLTSDSRFIIAAGSRVLTAAVGFRNLTISSRAK